MEDKLLVRLNLQIGGRHFAVKVDKSEVEGLKAVEAQVNARINEFMLKFPDKDRLDIFTMAFLSQLSEMENEKELRSTDELEEKLDAITKMLDSSL